jgi:hypothetical protein
MKAHFAALMRQERAVDSYLQAVFPLRVREQAGG